MEARKRRHTKDPEEGKDGKKKEPFIIRQSSDAIGRDLISRVADTLREICKQDVEAPTKAEETMPLPLAQKMSKVLDRCTSKAFRTELIEGLGDTYGFDMARKELMECWLIRVPYRMFYHDRPFQAPLGVMAFPAAHE